jgi:tetratricopeptide (TPR) repeat protein
MAISGVEICGREEELERLSSVVTNAMAGEGRFVCLTSPTGAGKTTLIEAVLARAEAGELGELEALRFMCQRSTPYGPFIELLSDLSGRDRKRVVAKNVWAIIKGTAPILLHAIPVAGELAAAGFTALVQGAGSGASQDAVSTQIGEALEKIAAEESPLLVVLDEAHLLDDCSCDVLRRFIAMGVPDRLVLLLAFDPQRIPAGHPLPQLRSDAVLTQYGLEIPLDPLDESDVAEMIRGRWGAQPHRLLAAWLVERCSGNAAFVAAFLRAFEDAGVVRRTEAGVELDGTLERVGDDWDIGGALEAAAAPASLTQVAELQRKLLAPDEQTLLQAASIQGEQFAGKVLVETLGADEAELRQRLTPLTERRLIVYDDDAWWNERSVVWRFDPRVLQTAFYGAATQSVFDRKQLHGRVADVLERIVADDGRPPGRILLQLARHREEAGQSEAAAGWLVKAAQAAVAAGSWRGAYQFCREALELLGAGGDDRLRAEATGLMLVAAAAFWDHVAALDESALRALAESGEQAARRLGEPGPIARVLYGRGQLAYVAEGYAPAIKLLREAVEFAAKDGDVVGRVLLMSRLGHALDSGEGLGAGLELLEQARDLLDDPGVAAALDPGEVAHARGMLNREIGVALYDLGDYAAAGPELEQAVTALVGAAAEDHVWALCFRAQLQAALGWRERAGADVETALSLLHPGAQSTRAFLLGLRARLAIEAGQLDKAGEDAAAALAEGEAAPDVTTTPLVRIFFAEIAVALQQYDEATVQLDLAAGDAYGAARVLVGAHTTRARLELARGEPDAAAESAAHALAELAAHDGAVPFFRTDEVLWWCAQALAAAGKDTANVLELARAAVERRAHGLSPEDDASYRSTPVAAGIAALPVTGPPASG